MFAGSSVILALAKGQVIHTQASVIDQYIVELAEQRWCFAAEKITVVLALGLCGSWALML